MQFLGASDTKVDTFTVTSLDGTTKQVSFTIHGANDAAVIGTPTVPDVTEDTSRRRQPDGDRHDLDLDADQNQASFQTAVTGAQGNLGSLTLAANGQLHLYGRQQRGAVPRRRDTKVDTFTVTSLDGTTKQVSFTIHGANDAAVIGDPTVPDVTEDTDVVNGNLTATGTISITDADQNQASFQTGVTRSAGQSRQPDARDQRQLHLYGRQQRGAVPRRQRHEGRQLHGDVV